jgi:hypothetical protein
MKSYNLYIHNKRHKEIVWNRFLFLFIEQFHLVFGGTIRQTTKGPCTILTTRSAPLISDRTESIVPPTKRPSSSSSSFFFCFFSFLLFSAACRTQRLSDPRPPNVHPISPSPIRHFLFTSSCFPPKNPLMLRHRLREKIEKLGSPSFPRPLIQNIPKKKERKKYK